MNKPQAARKWNCFNQLCVIECNRFSIFKFQRRKTVKKIVLLLAAVVSIFLMAFVTYADTDDAYVDDYFDDYDDDDVVGDFAFISDAY